MQIKIHNHNQNDKHERNCQQSQQIICFFFYEKPREKALLIETVGHLLTLLNQPHEFLLDQL